MYRCPPAPYPNLNINLILTLILNQVCFKVKRKKKNAPGSPSKYLLWSSLCSVDQSTHAASSILICVCKAPSSRRVTRKSCKNSGLRERERGRLLMSSLHPGAPQPPLRGRKAKIEFLTSSSSFLQRLSEHTCFLKGAFLNISTPDKCI